MTIVPPLPDNWANYMLARKAGMPWWALYSILRESMTMANRSAPYLVFLNKSRLCREGL